MNEKHLKNKFKRWARNITLILLGFIGVCALIYGVTFVASVTGRQSIEVDNIERKYRVYTPSGTEGSDPIPLVLAFHMLTTSGRTMEWLTHLNEVADQYGFIVVYPDGFKGSWADGSGQFAADQEGIDDIAFVATLIDELKEDYNIDEARVYATGFSNGGFLVQRMACELHDEIAAFATVGAVPSRNILKSCNATKPIPVMMIHGTNDLGVSWEGTQEYASVPETVAHWAVINGCSVQPEIAYEPDLADDSTKIRRESYTDCQDRSEMTLYVIEGGGHTWPSGSKVVQLGGIFTGKINQDIDASQVIWEFFQRHKLTDSN